MFKVEKIVGHRQNPKKKGSLSHILGKIQYLIKWEDWDSQYNTWQPPRHLVFVEDMITEYRKANGINSKEKSSNKLTTDGQKPKKNSNGHVGNAFTNIMAVISGTSNDDDAAEQQDNERMRKRARPTFHNLARSKQRNIQEIGSSLQKPKKKKILSTIRAESQESSFHKDQTSNSTTVYSSQQITEILSLWNDTKKQITILGMKKDGSDFWYYVSDNGKESWVIRDDIIRNYASCLCEFYEKNIIFYQK